MELADLPELRAARELQITREAFREFACAAVHDLNGPVGHVRAFVAILIDSVPEAVEPELVRHLNIASGRLQSVLNGLQAYAEAVTTPYTFEDVRAGDLVEAALSRFSPQIESGELVVVHGGLPVLHCSSQPIRMVFESLIDNAAKFRSPKPARVEIDAAAGYGEWVLSVRDNGIGVDQAQGERIFKPFKRLWGDRYPGCGMGLTIAKVIVERHGGRMWLGEAPTGGGACVQFSIPKLAEPGAPLARQPEGGPPRNPSQG